MIVLHHLKDVLIGKNRPRLLCHLPDVDPQGGTSQDLTVQPQQELKGAFQNHAGSDLVFLPITRSVLMAPTQHRE